MNQEKAQLVERMTEVTKVHGDEIEELRVSYQSKVDKYEQALEMEKSLARKIIDYEVAIEKMEQDIARSRRNNKLLEDEKVDFRKTLDDKNEYIVELEAVIESNKLINDALETRNKQLSNGITKAEESINLLVKEKEKA